MANGNLENDEVRPQLIKALALSEKPQKELAEEYGVTPAAICNFKKKHEHEITGFMSGVTDDMANLWVTDKAKRIKALQEDIELLDQMDHVDALKQKLMTFKYIEESLGQTPPKQTVNVTKQVNYVVKGVDLEDLA